MKKYIFLIIIGFVFSQCSQKTTAPAVEEVVQKVKTFRSSAPVPGEARPIKIGKATTVTLDNGLDVIVVENHKLPRVSYQLRLKNTAIQEGENAGYVSMAGQLVNKGTKTRSKADIDQSIDFIGASFNTSSNGMFASSLTKHQDKLLEIFSDVLYNPTFPQEEFDKIKKQTLSGLASSKSDPNSMSANVSAVLNYGKDHPYGEIETEETVERITLQMAKEYYDSWFVPNNAYLTIVGDITPEEAKMKAEKYFGTWKSKPVKNLRYNDVPSPSGANVAFVNKDGAVQSVINITYPIDMKPGADDELASSVMNSILGGSFSGRLNMNLREDKAYTYGARSNVSTDRLVGAFNASASVRNEVTDSSLVQFMKELNTMRTEKISNEDLQFAKNFMSGGFARSLESPQTIARFALNTIRYNLPADYYETYLQRLNAISVDDVMAMAKKYIRPENANIVIVGSKDEVADKLTVFDSDGVVDFYDSEGNLLVMDDTPLPSDVTGESIISDYINAIGGKDKLMAVKSLSMKMGTEMMGQAITIETYQKAPNKFAMKVGNGAMVFQEQKYDGKKGFSGGMQGSQVITEGKELDALKGQAVMFPELNYMDEGYTLDLKGTEDVEGTKCYKIVVTKPDGDKSTEFYAVDSSLLMRKVTSQDGGPQGMMTITNDMMDYKEVNGIMIPHGGLMTGAMPAPMKMKASEIKVNEELSDDMFKIEG